MGILDEVIDGLVHVTLLTLFFEADAFDELEVSNEENCREHVKVETVHLDVEPGHNHALGWIQVAFIAIFVAGKLLLKHRHLNIENGSLVAENGDRVTNSSKKFPDAISVFNFHSLAGDLFFSRFQAVFGQGNIAVLRRIDGAKSQSEKQEMTPTQNKEGSIRDADRVVGLVRLRDERTEKEGQVEDWVSRCQPVPCKRIKILHQSC